MHVHVHIGLHVIYVLNVASRPILPLFPDI